MNVSSTSTRPVSRSRPGRISTERSRCSIAHAVWYEPISRERWRRWADTGELGHRRAGAFVAVLAQRWLPPVVIDESPADSGMDAGVGAGHDSETDVAVPAVPH